MQNICIMNRYILVSGKFEGYVVYGYNKSGYLVHFENCSWMMPDAQTEGILRALGMALMEKDFINWVNDKGYIRIKLDNDLTFDRFWIEYDMQLDRLKAEKLWAKLNDAERQYVFYNVQAYKRYIHKNKTWYNQMRPASYLNGHWRDEWDKTKEIEKKVKQ